MIKGNRESYLQWPLHLEVFPHDSYGSMEICFYRGSDRGLATSMKTMRERASTGGVPKPDIYPSSAEFERVFNETQPKFNILPLELLESQLPDEKTDDFVVLFEGTPWFHNTHSAPNGHAFAV